MQLSIVAYTKPLINKESKMDKSIEVANKLTNNQSQIKEESKMKDKKYFVNGQELNNSVQSYGFFEQIKAKEIHLDKFPVTEKLDKTICEKESHVGFSYLRDDGMRRVKIDDLGWEEIVKVLKLSINHEDDLKIGKRLGRLFRIVDHYKWFKKWQISCYINENHGLHVDGYNLINLRLAKQLDHKARVGDIYALTYIDNDKYVKGHVEVKHGLAADFIFYDCNINKDVTLNSQDIYISLEKKKLSDKVRMDVQSMVNFFEGFGTEQIMDLGIGGVIKLVNDVKSGKFSELLDDFRVAEESNIKWGLHEAILRGIDYREYKGLYRAAIGNIRKTMSKFGMSGDKAVFNFPIIGAFAAYSAPDTRCYDKYGNLESDLAENEVYITDEGAIMFSPMGYEKRDLIHGTKDHDDRMVVIPITNNKDEAFIYRSPNDVGEYGIYTVVNWPKTIEIEARVKLNKDALAPRMVPVAKPVEAPKNKSPFDKLFEKVANKAKAQEYKEPKTYSRKSMLYAMYSMKHGIIGSVSNAGFIRSSVRISPKKSLDFAWNLNDIIDAGMLGKGAKIGVIYDMYKYIVDNKIGVAKCLIPRMPKGYYENDGVFVPLREKCRVANNHPVDWVLKGIEKYIDVELDRLYEVANSKVIKTKITPDGILALKAARIYDKYLDNRKALVDVHGVGNIEYMEGLKELHDKLSNWITKYNYDDQVIIVSKWIVLLQIAGPYSKDALIWIKNVYPITMDILASMGKAKYLETAGDQVVDKVWDIIFNPDTDVEYGKHLRRYSLSK